MLKPKSPQNSFYGSYLYDRIVPQDHLLRKINQVVDFSFVNDLVRDRYNPDFGRPAEDPEFMLRLCLLQYLYGDSDREVIENARLNNGYKYFLNLAVDEEVPDETTMSYFRTVRLGEDKFRQVFEQIVRQCIDKGLVKGKKQIIDSTHIEGDVARNSLAGIIRLCRRNLMQDISAQSPEVANRLDTQEPEIRKQDRFTRMEEGLEDEVAEAKKLLDAVTSELNNHKLSATPELVKDLGLLEKAAVGDRLDDATDRLVSPIDPDARSGKKTGKSWIGYKGHVIIEEDSEIITAVSTTPANHADCSQLPPLLKQQEEAHDLVPAEISADKAYDSGANLELLDAKQILGHISLARKANPTNLFTVEAFHYDPANETLTCPGGCTAVYHRRATFHTEKLKRNGAIFQFSPKQCNVCPLKAKCHEGHRGRAVAISFYEPLFQQMRERMESEEGKLAYRNRYKIEHKVADLARYCGMRHCRYRGLERASIHTLLSATTSNIKRMARLLWDNTGLSPQGLASAC
jgi:transposase